MTLLPSRAGQLCELPSGNLYTHPEFLDVVASVYHPGRGCRVRDYAVGGDVFRLLDIDGAGPSLVQTFVDFHEPIGRLPAQGPRPAALARLAGVARGVQAMDDFRQQPGWEEMQGAPTVVWESFDSWERYLELLQSRRVLSEDRRRRRKLADTVGGLEFQAHDEAPDVLPTCFEWKSGRDLSLGRDALFADERHRRFFEELAARRLLRASTLRSGKGELLAIWLGALHEGHWSGWVFTFNPAPELARFSPGRQLLYSMLEDSCRAGHREFDFSIGLEPYKLHFATHVRPIGLLGSPPPIERAAQAARAVLARYPALYDRARALRRRLGAVPAAGAPLSSGQS